MQDLLQRCIAVDPKERPSFTEIRKIFREDLDVTVADEDELAVDKKSAAFSSSAESHSAFELDHDEDDGGLDDDVGPWKLNERPGFAPREPMFVL